MLDLLHAAVQRGDIAAVGAIAAGHPALLAEHCANGWTALIVASFHGQSDVIRTLLARGADPNATNPKGTTPLMYAKGHYLRTGDATPMRLLLDGGADPAARTNEGLRLIDYVPEARRAEIEAIFAEAGRKSPAVTS